jgi:hypothetical protein
MFRHCQYEHHDSLNSSFNHIKYNMKKILRVEELNII